MLDRLAKAISDASNVRAFGLYDYSGYPKIEGGLKPHVVREEIQRKSRVVFESDCPVEARVVYEKECRHFIARAALQAIREAEPLSAWAGSVQFERAKAEGWDANSAAHIIFTAMIDAILTEGDKTP